MRIHFFTASLFAITKQAASKEAAEKRFIKKEKYITSLSIFGKKKIKVACKSRREYGGRTKYGFYFFIKEAHHEETH